MHRIALLIRPRRLDRVLVVLTILTLAGSIVSLGMRHHRRNGHSWHPKLSLTD